MENKMSIQMALTERCNLKCKQCDLWGSKNKRQELDTQQWKDIFIKIKDWLGSSYQLNFGGGEPFMREDMVELIEFCAVNDITTTLVTNTTLLNKNIIKRISGIKTLTVLVSLDGFNKEIHNNLRGKGVYENVIDTLHFFKACNRECQVVLATVIMNDNFKEIIPILNDLVVDKQLADFQIVQALWISDSANLYENGWYKKNALWPREDKVGSLLLTIDELVELKKKNAPILNPLGQLQFFKLYFTRLEKCIPVFPCDIGKRNFLINPSGEILLCWNLNPIGNILKDSPERIWNSEIAEQRRKQILACKRVCRILNCNFNFDNPLAIDITN
ncbi:MAG: radical SAM protein [Candidatus Omnitrophica bacterium]|nr:radical SAM protein [Candidatus Omnitrophota bacterium]